MKIIYSRSTFMRAANIGRVSSRYNKVEHHMLRVGTTTAHAIGTRADAERIMNTRVHALAPQELRERGHME